MGLSKKNKEALTAPLFKDNPVTVQVLGICSALAVTNKLEPAIVMGRIAEEAEVVNLHRPFACPIVIISFHRTVLICCKFNVFLAYSNGEKAFLISGMHPHSHVHGNASNSCSI